MQKGRRHCLKSGRIVTMTEEDETGHPDERAEGYFCGLRGLLRYRRRLFAHSGSGRTKLAFEWEGVPLVLGGVFPVSVAGRLGAGARKEVGVECRDGSDALWTGGRALNTAGFCFVLLQDTFHKNPISPHLRSFAVGKIKSLAVLTLFILARRSYQTAFGAVPTGTEPGTELKKNSYVRPVALGVLFLMIGGLMLLHPISGKYSPTSERVVALVFTGILGAGAPLCFFERRAKVVRRLAIFAIVTAVAGLAVSMTMYAFFAIEGLCVSGAQLVVSIAALVTARKAWQSFVD